ncbi:histidine phosphatase family protein [Terribacillus sp. JSM ZJ617]|uniref:histidine phosphatase family protein n=1 Tax=Terribacillus sp. JSM ZJ617 TaxID=3342119 RepID=UPI0035A9446E
MKRIILVRHCNAQGQHKDSPLTYEGINEARSLAAFLKRLDYPIQRVLSSPFFRAVETIKPFADAADIPIELDRRLQERILSEEPVDDWLEVLEESFADFDLRLPGGESSNDARIRVRALIDELEAEEHLETVVLVTHGNLLAILLKEFQTDIGFSHWKGFSNPDVFLVQRTGGSYMVERIWNA